MDSSEEYNLERIEYEDSEIEDSEQEESQSEEQEEEQEEQEEQEDEEEEEEEEEEERQENKQEYYNGLNMDYFEKSKQIIKYYRNLEKTEQQCIQIINNIRQTILDRKIVVYSTVKPGQIDFMECIYCQNTLRNYTALKKHIYKSHEEQYTSRQDYLKIHKVYVWLQILERQLQKSNQRQIKQLKQYFCLTENNQ